MSWWSAPDPHDPLLLRQRRLAALGLDRAQLESERLTACNLCGGTYLARIARRDRYGLAVDSCQCQRCGLVFLNPRPSAAGYQAFYRRWYRPLIRAWSSTLGETASRTASQRAYAERLDRELLGRHLSPHHRRLLDLGASSGEVALHFHQHHGMDALCVDPSPEESAAARAHGLDAVCTTAEDFDPGARRFDLVLLCQSIDHLLDPAAVLRRIHGWLEPDGLLYVDPLDFTAMCARAGYLSGALKIDHPYYLTRTTMDLYLARVGFEPIELDLVGGFHLRYVCRKSVPVDARPEPEATARAIRTIRHWQSYGRAPAARRLGMPERIARAVRRGLQRNSERDHG